MLAEDIPILQKMYELYKTFYSYSLNFPKKDRFGIGQRCEDLMLTLLQKIIRASKTSRDIKKRALYEVSIDLDTLKILIRLMKDVRVLDLKKYTVLQENLHEIGKMLGGWIKSLW